MRTEERQQNLSLAFDVKDNLLKGVGMRGVAFCNHPGLEMGRRHDTFMVFPLNDLLILMVVERSSYSFRKGYPRLEHAHGLFG